MRIEESDACLLGGAGEIDSSIAERMYAAGTLWRRELRVLYSGSFVVNLIDNQLVST